MLLTKFGVSGILLDWMLRKLIEQNKKVNYE